MTNRIENHSARIDAVDHEAALREYLAEFGVADTSGLDLLRLVRRAGNAYDAILDEQVRESQLSGPRWGVLMRLLFAEKHGMPSVNPTQLSKSQHVSRNTISAHLRSLEEMGLIEREVDPNDRRQFRIRLSQKGRALIEKSAPAHMTFLNQLAGGLSADERRQLVDLLRRLLESMAEQATCESLQKNES